MTEYTTSSQAYREYMSARERTTHWLQGISGGPSELYSPSVPPSVLEGLVPSSPPSEADSTGSAPPKMILRYGDGRPDVPIPHTNGMGRSGSKRHHDLARSQTLSYNRHSPARTRSGSSAGSPSYGSHSHPFESEPRAPPEEIRVLPTYGDVPASSTSSRPSYSRSKSLPRTSDHRHHEPEPEVPFLPQHMQKQSPFYPHAGPVNPHAASTAPPQRVGFAQPSQWPPRDPHSKHPPAIIYAPSHHTQRPHYAPPAMFHHPPQMGPNGMIYSHSAPVPGQYPPAYPTPYPSVGSHRHTSSAHDVRMDEDRRERMRSLGRSTRVSPTESSESLASEKSGSTYYVLPAHGQKVHVIAPSPEQSIITATSTTKSATSPHFPARKPFFQRLFNFKKFSHAGSAHGSSGGRKLHRRHSLNLSGEHGSRESSDNSQ